MGQRSIWHKSGWRSVSLVVDIRVAGEACHSLFYALKLERIFEIY